MNDTHSDTSFYLSPMIVPMSEAASQLDALIDISVAGQTVLIGISPNHFVRLTPLSNHVE